MSERQSHRSGRIVEHWFHATAWGHPPDAVTVASSLAAVVYPSGYCPDTGIASPLRAREPPPGWGRSARLPSPGITLGSGGLPVGQRGTKWRRNQQGIDGAAVGAVNVNRVAVQPPDRGKARTVRAGLPHHSLTHRPGPIRTRLLPGFGQSPGPGQRKDERWSAPDSCNVPRPSPRR
jgi:hypothetical protein